MKTKTVFSFARGKIDLINAVLLSIYRFLRHIIDEVDIKVDQVPQLCISTILKLQNEESVNMIFIYIYIYTKKKKKERYKKRKDYFVDI